MVPILSPSERFKYSSFITLVMTATSSMKSSTAWLNWQWTRREAVATVTALILFLVIHGELLYQQEKFTKYNKYYPNMDKHGVMLCPIKTTSTCILLYIIIIQFLAKQQPTFILEPYSKPETWQFKLRVHKANTSTYLILHTYLAFVFHTSMHKRICFSAPPIPLFAGGKVKGYGH